MTAWLVGLACLWVLASAAVAMLPMRRQFLPGIALLITAPVLVAAIWSAFGAVSAAAFTFAVGSMYRNPLRYFYRRARGLPVSLPPELTRSAAEGPAPLAVSRKDPV